MRSPHLVEHVLESVLTACRVHVEIVPHARTPESMRTPSTESSAGHFYLIGMDECLLVGPTPRERTELHSGDLAIFQSGTGYRILATPMDRDESPAGDSASMLYGNFDFPMGNRSSLAGSLPNCLVVKSRDASPYVRQLASILLDAARETRFGQQMLIDKLAGSLLAFAVCEYASRTEALHAIVTPIHDARIARALRAFHERSGEEWSVRSLAAMAGMSRSSFALHFTTAMGLPPMQYAALWRVAQAKQLLKDSRLSVASVAELLGYSSEAAFRKLFKRVEGVGPGNARTAARFGNVSALRSASRHNRGFTTGPSSACASISTGD